MDTDKILEPMKRKRGRPKTRTDEQLKEWRRQYQKDYRKGLRRKNAETVKQD